MKMFRLNKQNNDLHFQKHMFEIRTFKTLYMILSVGAAGCTPVSIKGAVSSR